MEPTIPLSISLLGPIRVVLNGELVTHFRSEKALALLAYLAAESDRPHRRTNLAGLLWPDQSEGSARHNLSQTLLRLRSALKESGSSQSFIGTTRQTIQLKPGNNLWIDLLALQQHLKEAEKGAVPQEDVVALSAMERAVALYNGEFLEGFFLADSDLFEEWALTKRERIRRTFLETLDCLTEAYLLQENYELVCRYAAQTIELEPLREQGHRILMRALTLRGQRNAALTHYEHLRQLLQKELGVEPASETVALYELIQSGHLQVQQSKYSMRQKSLNIVSRQIAEETSIAENVTPILANNLPKVLTSFVGRQKEVQKLGQLLGLIPNQSSDGNHQQIPQKRRLVTLTGPGGVGKTRLVLTIAKSIVEGILSGNQTSPKYPDGIWFVDLVSCEDELNVVEAVASVIGVREEGPKPLSETLVDYLRSKQLLLILDNCEHLHTACVEFIFCLLRDTHSLQILATSREVFRLPSESVLSLEPLKLPESDTLRFLDDLLDNEALQLFCERAIAVQPTFALTEENAAYVVHICQMLDGIPLAIELAATRVKLLSVQQIAEQLAQNSANHFRIIRHLNPIKQPRHHTLDALISWSYRLLTKAEQTLLRRLSIFASGFSFEVVEAICMDVKSDSSSVEEDTKQIFAANILDMLGMLVEKSLVVAEPVDDQMRYRLLESIKYFASEKLAENNEAGQLRNVHLFFYIKLLEQIDSERPKLPRPVWRQRISLELNNVRTALRWALQSQQGISGIRLSLAMGDYWFNQGFHSEAQMWLRSFLALPDMAEATPLRLMALSAMEFTEWWSLEKYESAYQLQREVMRLAEKLQDWVQVEKTYNNMGWVALRSGDSAAARSNVTRSLAMSENSGNQINRAWSLMLLAEIALLEKDNHGAASHFAKAAQLLRQLGSQNLLAYPVRHQGYLALFEQDMQKAYTCCYESLRINCEVGSPEGVLASLAAYARLLLAKGEKIYATQLGALVEAQLFAGQLRLTQLDRKYYTEFVQELRSDFSETIFQSAWSQGLAMNLQKAIDDLQIWGDTHFPAVTTTTEVRPSQSSIEAKGRQLLLKIKERYERKPIKIVPLST